MDKHITFTDDQEVGYIGLCIAFEEELKRPLTPDERNMVLEHILGLDKEDELKATTFEQR